ncbi:MAG: methionine biosynthesis protein MetW [Omnitrophica bacterium]|nr:methionine biosynthesis protein MetW [Candidatus Omnitrophota bacterium]
MKKDNTRLDHKIIYSIIEPKSRVLDLGCGDGELLAKLVEGKNIKAQGIELNNKAIYKCVERGLNVSHSNVDDGLKGYPDKSFDYVILNQSMQEAKKVDYVMKEALRVGKKVVVGFPNFAYLTARLRVFFKGKVPITPSLPYHWYSTPNLHFLSISDFRSFCLEKKITIIKAYYLGEKKAIQILPNLFALNAIFIISR